MMPMGGMMPPGPGIPPLMPGMPPGMNRRWFPFNMIGMLYFSLLKNRFVDFSAVVIYNYHSLLISL